MPGPRPGTVLLWIAGVLLAGLIAVVVAGSAFGLFVASHIRVQHEQHGSTKEVSVSSPFGDLNVKADGDAAVPGMPVYPGASRVPPDQPSAFNHGVHDDGVSIGGKHPHNAHVHLEIAGKNIDVNAAEYAVDAPAARVEDFYRQKLQSWGTVIVKADRHDQTELKVKETKDNERVVVIGHGDDGRTHFMLVHVTVGDGPV